MFYYYQTDDGITLEWRKNKQKTTKQERFRFTQNEPNKLESYVKIIDTMVLLYWSNVKDCHRRTLFKPVTCSSYEINRPQIQSALNTHATGWGKLSYESCKIIIMFEFSSGIFQTWVRNCAWSESVRCDNAK